MRALIVEDGTQRSALAAARALGRAGWQVGVASPVRGFAGRSKFARWHAVPSPHEASSRFVDGVAAAVRAGGYDVVMAAGDPELLNLTAGRDRIPAAVAHPPHDLVVQALDKLLVTEAAQRAGLAVPWTATTVPDDGPDGPFIVKERLHGKPDEGGGGATAYIPVRIAATRAEAQQYAAEADAGGGQALVQEVVKGDLLAVIALLDNESRAVATMAQIADRVWPAGAGPSVRATVVPLDESLRIGVERLLADLRWTGLVQLQFIVPADGAPRLIDFNGRIYGSIALAEKAGLPLVPGWAALATGREVPAFPMPVIGSRYRWLEGDLRRALKERRGGLAKDVLETLVSARGAVLGIVALDDPRPGLHLGYQLASRGVRKVRSKWTRPR